MTSLPKNEDTEIPIRYCNDYFNQELYEQIESIQVVIPLTVVEVTNKYGISTLYSMLAELEKMEKIPGEYHVRNGPCGMTLHLKDGKSVGVGFFDGSEISFDSAWYSCQYGAQSSYGKGYDHSGEINHIVEMIKPTL